MRNQELIASLSAALLGVMTMAVSCGGSGVLGGSGTTGSSGTGGGSGGVASASASTGSPGVTASSTSSSGGFGGATSATSTSSTGGSGGAPSTTSSSSGGGLGGASSTGAGTTSTGTGTGGAGLPNACPATQPVNMASCAGMEGDVCPYGAIACSCGQGALGSAWYCDPCPAIEPATGSVCSSSTACLYGSDSCSCNFGQWACATCPATKPADPSACSMPDTHCMYAAAECTCFPNYPMMMGAGWLCNGPCPATPPPPGTSCSATPNAHCIYGATVCQCEQGQFSCA